MVGRDRPQPVSGRLACPDAVRIARHNESVVRAPVFEISSSTPRSHRSNCLTCRADVCRDHLTLGHRFLPLALGYGRGFIVYRINTCFHLIQSSLRQTTS